MPTRSKPKTNKGPETILFNTTKSYTSLVYGVLTVIIVFIIIFLGLRAASQRSGMITEEAGHTEEISKTYTVQKGDTLWSIAEKNYNDPMMWDDIARENKLSNAGVIEPGMKLKLPNGNIAVAAGDVTISAVPSLTVKPTEKPVASPTVAPTAKPTVKPAAQPAKTPAVQNIGSKISGNSYTVVSGDNLWNIAVRAYGDGYKWTELAKANKLENPRIIHRGNHFVIPR